MNRHDKSQSKKQQPSNQPTQINQNDLNKDIHKGTDMITSLIHEYLLKKEYTRTLDVYQEELNMKIKNKTYFIPSYQEINENMLMQSFMQGNKGDFFK